MEIYIYLYIFLASLSLSYLLVPIIRKLALRFDIIDHPGERKVHQKVKPLLGGLAIYLAFTVVVLGSIAGLLLLGKHPLGGHLLSEMISQIPRLLLVLPKLLALLLGGTIMAFIGILDDVKGVNFSPKLKFAGQIICALVLVGFGVHTTFMPSYLLNALITVLWIVGISNSFNLLDNMDGLSGGTCLISSLLFFLVAHIQGQFFTALILLALSGAVLGFLRYNFFPSRIFMGDTGSLFIGFILGSLTIITSYVTKESTSLLPVVMPILILGVPLFDTFSVIYIRLASGRPIFKGDKCHFSHRLCDLGMSQVQAVLFIYAVAICVGLSALLLPTLNGWESILVLIQAGVIFGLIVVLMVVGKKNALRWGG